METFKKAAAAGFMIGIGAIVYISCDSKLAGALMFTVGLFGICSFGMNLFTGKIGYIFSNRNKPNCLVIWLGNLVGASVGMALARIAKPSLHTAAREMMNAKLQQSYIGIPILALFCGVLMYIAVENYRANPHGAGKVVGLFLCVGTFILCGFEHSVADMCYAALAAENIGDILRYTVFLIAVSVFNGIGALAVRFLTSQKEK
ncbi:MAG: formate/nitrite transporter family protein [Bacteroides sp.]|nr:formate/nitrite transporter family protein [Bacteroides sp.]